MKEIWEIDPAKHTRRHRRPTTMGWPLGKNAGGGGFVYHAENNQVFVGFVVHLNYENPHLYPYMEFQRMKHHPMIAELLEGRQARGLRRAGGLAPAASSRCRRLPSPAACCWATASAW